jgi:NodT family efflux transporter outer membrane factor (OMF) lipoprotein
MRLTMLVSAVALAVALAGCASSGGLHPDATPLQAASLQATRSLWGAPLTPAAWPAADWWTALGDPQLDALIAEALKGNPDLAIADARARQAAAQLAGADAARKPSLTANASVSGARLPTGVLGNDLGGHFAVIKYGYLDFKWGLDPWGGSRAAWEAALGAARAADIDARTARLQLSANVARAYAQLGYACIQQDIAQAELERSSDARKLTAQRVQAGIDSKLQIKQSDAEVANAEQQVAAVAREVDAARTALAVLLGQGPDRGLDIARPQPLTPAMLALPSDLPAELLGRRPDLVAARWRVEAAAQDIKAAKTKFLPNISLGALAGLAATGGGSLLEASALFYQVAPAVSLPIFDGGRLRANLQGKDAQYDLAVARYNKTLVGALNQIADRLHGLQSLKAQSAAQQRALDAAREAWDLAQQRYKAGIGSYLDALSVRQQLLQAEQAGAALHAQQVDLSVQMIEALGGGYRPRADRADTAAVPTHD